MRRTPAARADRSDGSDTGIAVGSRARFEAMNRAIVQHRLRPVIDSTFALAEGAEAFKRMHRGEHFGKIVVAL